MEIFMQQLKGYIFSIPQATIVERRKFISTYYTPNDVEKRLRWDLFHSSPVATQLYQAKVSVALVDRMLIDIMQELYLRRNNES